MPEINFAQAQAYGLSSSATQAQLDAAVGAAGGATFVSRPNVDAILIAVSDVVRAEKGLSVGEAREFTLALHPGLRAVFTGH